MNQIVDGWKSKGISWLWRLKISWSQLSKSFTYLWCIDWLDTRMSAMNAVPKFYLLLEKLGQVSKEIS